MARRCASKGPKAKYVLVEVSMFLLIILGKQRTVLGSTTGLNYSTPKAWQACTLYTSGICAEIRGWATIGAYISPLEIISVADAISKLRCLPTCPESTFKHFRTPSNKYTLTVHQIMEVEYSFSSLERGQRYTCPLQRSAVDLAS